MIDLIPKKKNTNILEAKEENLLNWNEILAKLKTTFGNDVYESWIKNTNLKKEFNHYVILSVPTRFVRDWIVSRYADKILDIIKIFKKSIQRLEFLIEENHETANQLTSFKKNTITPIENSLLIITGLIQIIDLIILWLVKAMNLHIRLLEKYVYRRLTTILYLFIVKLEWGRRIC